MAEFRNIHEVFGEHNLELPVLNLLVPDVQTYTTLAIQPGGEIAVRNDFVGHANYDLAVAQFRNFIAQAVQRNCDLVISPEYSCPWEALADAIANGALPSMGRLWVLGCEAITPAVLEQFILAHPQVVWIREPMPAGTGNFLDVVAYVTKAKEIGGEIRNVITLQFKTHPMGGDSFERDNLICGRRIYIWHNPLENIRIICLICADALTFDEHAQIECRFDLYPFIILHPQLVVNPRFNAYRQYRSRLFMQNSEHYEVIALNWARGFVIPGTQPNQYGGSAIYTKSDRFETGDDRLNANHARGLIYTYWGEQHTELCLFNFDPHVFYYRMPKTRQNVLAAVAQRTGPEMLSLQSWNAESNQWLDTQHSDDGFEQMCMEYHIAGCNYCLDAPNTPMDRERLLILSAGSLQTSLNWHHPKNMSSFIVSADERSQRLTFTHEQEQASRDFRNLHLSRYITLQMEILSNPAHFPSTIEDLSGNWRLQAPRGETGFRFNLESLDDETQRATVIFLDLTPPDEVTKLRDNLIRAWGKAETRRLVIWYRLPDGIRNIHSPPAEITDDLEPPATVTSPPNS